MAQPFLFERRFDRAGPPVIAGAVARPRCGPAGAGAAPFDFPSLQRSGAPDAVGPHPAPPAPTFSEADLRAAVAAAVAEAEAATEARVCAELEAGIAARQTAALERIAADLAAHRTAFERWLAARATASRDLALALARALVPRALERQPLADIEAMLRDLLGRLEEEPRLTLALPPDLAEDGRQLFAQLAAQAGYRGELLVEPDPTLDAGDARLSWRGGSAERDLAALEREAIALVDAWLPETAAAARPTNLSDLTTEAATP
jgi:flagellar assembly protein FliH